MKKQSVAGCNPLNPSNFATLGSDDPLAISNWGLTGQGITGNYDPSFSFTNTSAIAIELEGTITGDSTDKFGYYDALNPGGVVLFTAAGAAETTFVIPGGDTFGFFSITPDGTVFTESDGIQQFALFSADNAGGDSNNRLTNNYYIGVEDLLGAGGTDFDYNDLVVHVQAVPEPGSLPCSSPRWRGQPSSLAVAVINLSPERGS